MNDFEDGTITLSESNYHKMVLASNERTVLRAEIERLTKENSDLEYLIEWLRDENRRQDKYINDLANMILNADSDNFAAALDKVLFGKGKDGSMTIIEIDPQAEKDAKQKGEK